MHIKGRAAWCTTLALLVTAPLGAVELETPTPRLETGVVSTQPDPSAVMPMGVDVNVPTGGGKGDKDEWVYAPVPGYNPVLGATLLVGVAKIYRPKGQSPDAPAWISGGGAFVSENGSWAIGAGQKMNLDDDRWRLTGGLVYADINYRYYGIGNDAGDQDTYVPIRQQAPGLMTKCMAQVAPSWYLGVRLLAANSTIRLNPEELPPEIPPPPGWENTEDALKLFLASAAPTLEYDSRDDDFFPRKGVLFSAEASLFTDILGSDFNFQIYTLAYNQYFTLNSRSVLAVRGYVRAGKGDIPFFAMSTLGQGCDLRGYTSGRYRDEALVSTQAEYRYELSRRWTLVGFAGVGGVGPGLGHIPQALPAGGVGVRFSLGKENKVNLRLDLAWGKDDSAIYLAVGEAF